MKEKFQRVAMVVSHASVFATIATRNYEKTTIIKYIWAGMKFAPK